MNNLFDYQEKKKNPIGIMNLDFSTDLTPYVPAMDKIILDRVENRLGLDPNKLLDFAYQVSGEYSMLSNAVEKKIINKDAIFENLMSFKRAGANAIVSYYADRLNEILP